MARYLCLCLLLWPALAAAGPETAMREFASAQIKKGVRTIGMGGDGATTGNYSLVWKDASTAVVDYGRVYFADTGNQFDFTAVGVTTPKFWKDATFYIIALSQQATDLHVWAGNPATGPKPPSLGAGSNNAVFGKLAKPLTETLSLGVMVAYELSQMTLQPDGGAAPIRFATGWLPSGGAGVTWQPNKMVLAGLRAILNHDNETRSQGTASQSGLLRSYEYRAGVALMPWWGGLVDVGGVMLQRWNGVDGTHTSTFALAVGAEQMLIDKRLWLRGGRDENAWTAGASVRAAPVKFDVAYVVNLGVDRTNGIFGKDGRGVLGTLTLDFGDWH